MMRFPFLGTIGAGVLALILAACNAAVSGVDTTTATATRRIAPTSIVLTIPYIPAPTTQIAARPQRSTAPPLPTPQPRVGCDLQFAWCAEEVGAILTFIRAYNAGNLDAAVAVLDDRIGVSDCDYQRVRPIAFMGKTAVTDWLRQRMADHDQLTVEEIEVSGDALGIVYSRRTSDTLRKLGFPNGIQPSAGTKVVVTSDRKHLATFANGPVGGDPAVCRPAN
jgi:hypothetical protein